MIHMRANRMVNHHVVLLIRFRRLANNMDYSNPFGQATHNPIESAEFANTMRGNEYTWDTFDSSVPVGGVSSVQLVGIADKVQAWDVVNIIEEIEVEISWHSLNSFQHGALQIVIFSGWMVPSPCSHRAALF